LTTTDGDRRMSTIAKISYLYWLHYAYSLDQDWLRTTGGSFYMPISADQFLISARILFFVRTSEIVQTEFRLFDLIESIACS
jgi:hypothetical protein